MLLQLSHWMSWVTRLPDDPSQENVCSKYPVINLFLNFKHVSGPHEPDQSFGSLWKLALEQLREVGCSFKENFNPILHFSRQKKVKTSPGSLWFFSKWKIKVSTLSYTTTRSYKNSARFSVNAGICAEFCLICFIKSVRKYDIVLRNVNTLTYKFVAIQVKGFFSKSWQTWVYTKIFCIAGEATHKVGWI